MGCGDAKDANDGEDSGDGEMEVDNLNGTFEDDENSESSSPARFKMIVYVYINMELKSFIILEDLSLNSVLNDGTSLSCYISSAREDGW